MRKTFSLDPDKWDLYYDGNGDISITTGRNASAQDVASACLTFKGEVIYDTTLGIPWKTDFMGKTPSMGYLASLLEAEAEKLPFVTASQATVFFDKETRQVRGLISVTSTDGEISLLL